MQSAIQYIKEQLHPFYPQTEINAFIRLIFSHTLHIQPYEIISCKDRKIPLNECEKIKKIVSELRQYRPIQQILGETEFYGLRFYINEQVLIPRPETEELVDLILKNHNSPGLTILDIGTGSGCIAISLARYLNKAAVYALDVSPDALELAERNAQLNEVNVRFVEQDILIPFSSSFGLPEAFDIIVSNPPYVTPAEKVDMQANVLKYEPHLALFTPGDQPLLFYERIARIGLERLSEKGFIYVEINSQYGDEVTCLFRNNGYGSVKLFRDISGKDRIIRAGL